MITSNTSYSFGGKIAIVETQSFICMISTAKEGFLLKQSTRFSDCTNGTSNRKLIANLRYNKILGKQERLGLHDVIVGVIDEAGKNGSSLKDALQTLFNGLEKQGVAVGQIF